jgi:hypothetical protein
MKILVAFLVLLGGTFADAKGTSWYFTQWILSSGVKISDCSQIQGGYEAFLKKLKPQMKSMGMDDCMESNSQGFKTNVLICPSPSHNGNSISGYWFKDKKECETKKNEMESK